MKAHIKGPSDYKISACTIAKNEEETIAKSIDSYKYFVDEIIVVDTGSTDNTIKVAQEHGATVYNYEWNNDFAAAKNAALEHATGDWIVFLDADEYFVEDCGKRVREAIVEAEARGNGSIGCRMVNINKKTGSVIAEIFSIRVMKRGFKYQFTVHEEPVREDGRDILVAEKSWFFLYHTGYDPEVIKGKAKRNLDIILERLKNETNPARRVVYQSYLSDSYSVLQDHEKTIESSKEFIAGAIEYNIRLIGCEGKAHLNLIASLEATDADIDEITYWVNDLNKKCPDYPDAAYAKGRLFIQRKMFKSALAAFDSAQEILEHFTDTYPSVLAGNPSELYYGYGIACEGLMNVPDALKWYYKSFEAMPENDRAIRSLFRLIKNMPQDAIDELANPIYGVEQKRLRFVLTGLMQNYMSSQILKCYSVHRFDKSSPVDTNVSAFIMAGNGDYFGATKMFELAFAILKDGDTAMRALICAVLSGNEDLIGICSASCTPSQMFTLGLRVDTGKDDPNITEISKVISEMSILKGGAYVSDLSKRVSVTLNQKDLSLLVVKLERLNAFDAALTAAYHQDIRADTVFMLGYLLYRLHRFNEAADILNLARKMGFEKPELSEIYDNLQKLREINNHKISLLECSQLKWQIEHKIEQGLYNEAADDIFKYKQLAEADVDIFTAEAVVMYYSGEYKRSAIAAQCGLMKDENNFDILYNLGIIYERMGELPNATLMYQRALNNCVNDGAAETIMQSLKLIEEQSCR